MSKGDGCMSADKAIPPTDSLNSIAEFWDTHSLADYWDQTEPAEFKFDPKARRHPEIEPGADASRITHHASHPPTAAPPRPTLPPATG